MEIEEKIAKGKPTKWVVDGLSRTEIKSTVELARSFCNDREKTT